MLTSIGHPQPWVTWWQGGQLLDNVTDARTQESVSNLLVVPRINRRHLHDAFTCQVTSSPHVAPIMKTVTLELHRKCFFYRFFWQLVLSVHFYWLLDIRNHQMNYLRISFKSLFFCDCYKVLLAKFSFAVDRIENDSKFDVS